MSAEERVRDLMVLLGCHFRGGRAATAPRLALDLKAHEQILATEMVYEVEGPRLVVDDHAYPATEWEGTLVPEAYLHDSRCLPHLVKGDLAVLFPRVIAADELEEEAEAEDWLEEIHNRLLEAEEDAGVNFMKGNDITC